MWPRVQHLLTLLGILQQETIPAEEEAPLIPPCMQPILHQIAAEPVWNPPAKLTHYSIEGDDYYYFPTRCCDIYSDLYDEDCQLICHPDGGIIGIGDGKCPFVFDKWDPNATLLWEDERTLTRRNHSLRHMPPWD